MKYSFLLLLFALMLNFANAEFAELGAFAKVAPNDKINVQAQNEDGTLEEWGASTKEGKLASSEKIILADYSVSVRASRKAINAIYSAEDPLSAYHQARGKGLVQLEFRAWDRKIFAFFGDLFIGIYFIFVPPKKIYDFGIGMPVKITTIATTVMATVIPTTIAPTKIQELEEFQYNGVVINYGLLDFPFNELGCRYGDNEFGLMGTPSNSSFSINRSLPPVDQGRWGNFSCGPCVGGAGLDYWDRNGYSNISTGSLDDLIRRLHILMGTDGTTGINIGDFVGGFVFRLNETGYAANFTIKFWLDQPDKPPVRRFRINGVSVVNNNPQPNASIILKEMSEGEVVMLGLSGRFGVQHIVILDGVNSAPDANGNLRGRVMDPGNGQYTDVTMDDSGGIQADGNPDGFFIDFIVSISPKDGKPVAR